MLFALTCVPLSLLEAVYCRRALGKEAACGITEKTFTIQDTYKHGVAITMTATRPQQTDAQMDTRNYTKQS